MFPHWWYSKKDFRLAIDNTFVLPDFGSVKNPEEKPSNNCPAMSFLG
jgi:hypothetical protein